MGRFLSRSIGSIFIDESPPCPTVLEFQHCKTRCERRSPNQKALILEVSEATSALPRWDKFLSTCPQSLCLSPVSRHPIWPSFILNPSASLQDFYNHSTHGFRDAPSRKVDWEEHCMGHAATLSPHSDSTFPIPIRATHPLTPRSDPPFSLLGLQICAANQPALPIHSFRVEDGEAVPALSPSPPLPFPSPPADYGLRLPSQEGEVGRI